MIKDSYLYLQFVMLVVPLLYIRMMYDVSSVMDFGVLHSNIIIACYFSCLSCAGPIYIPLHHEAQEFQM